MKEKDIIIGTKYGNINYSGYTYLGCGERQTTKKNDLVIIGAPKGCEEYVGAVVVNPETKEKKKIFWDGFYTKN